jgi:GH25 family lysozyme M1 (1,4-beta-N-acetylmuramidase)
VVIRTVVVAALALGTVIAVSPAASAEPLVVNGVVRDNVENTHSPRMADEFGGAARVGAAANVRGIDVASHQHPNGAAIDWTQVAGSGVRFVGVKASEGNYYANPYFADDHNGARAAGMFRFAYHFGTPNDSGALEQADYFLDRAQYVPDGRTLNPVLDIEWNPYAGTNACYGLTPAQMVSWIREFVTEVKRRTGVPAIIYTAAAWWSECTGGSTAFGANPLWVASYLATPSLPAGWSNWTLWQYSDSTTVPGVSTTVDGNYVNGGEATLAALAMKASDPSGYTAAPPARVLDTRAAIGVGGTAPLGAGKSITLDLSGRLPATTTAVVLNVTGIAQASTYVTVWPSGSARPNASNLNLVAGDVRPNLVTTQVGADRKVQLYNNTGSTHLLADLAGWYTTDAPGLYTAQAPQRVLDTRSTSPAGQGGKITLDLSSRVPAAATAVTVNLTGVGATRGTFVAAWPTGQPRPNVSNLNLSNANPTSNLVTVALGANRSIDLYNNTGAVHLLADLAGYYAPDSGSRFVAVSPMRVLDTRSGPVSWVAATGGGQAVSLAMRGPIPAGATAAVMNLTGVNPSAATFVSAYPKTTATPVRPSTSTLNLARAQTLPNLTSVAVGPNADVWLFNSVGSISLIADLAGYFVA